MEELGIMGPADSVLEELLKRAAQGEEPAQAQLLMEHRPRLVQMIGLRLDRRLRSRIDPSDVVQEALLQAYQEFPDYVRDRLLPLYPWLRQIALNRLIDLHRRHLK